MERAGDDFTAKHDMNPGAENGAMKRLSRRNFVKRGRAGQPRPDGRRPDAEDIPPGGPVTARAEAGNAALAADLVPQPTVIPEPAPTSIPDPIPIPDLGRRR
jgi:hypothetical protein